MISRGCDNGSYDCYGALIDLGQTSDGVTTRGCDSRGVDNKGVDIGNKGCDGKGCANMWEAVA